MQVFNIPPKKEWKSLLARPALNALALTKTVGDILEDVKNNGDAAIKKYSLLFDGIAPANLELSAEQFNTAEKKLSPALKDAILQAAANIKRFHEKQIMAPEIVETMPGVHCWRKSVPIQKVGLYIPGGTAPLFSTVLMLGIPAALAGCPEIILCTPPSKDPAAVDDVHPAIIYAAKIAGVTKVCKAGGVQAIAALAYGTETVPQVYKIFGPGNQYVTCAKQMLQQEGIAIDMPAGPSEVAVYADETSVPAFIAADLLSQAEHGPDSQVLLVISKASIGEAVAREITQQLELLPRRSTAANALDNSKMIIAPNVAGAIDLLNEYAPEHLILSCADADAIAEKIVNAGSVFIGNYSPESVGDYASGTNHTLPTNGHAKAYSGVSVDSFVKKITFQKLTEQGLQNIAQTVEAMAAAEGLDAHKNAVTIRLRKPGK